MSTVAELFCGCFFVSGQIVRLGGNYEHNNNLNILHLLSNCGELLPLGTALQIYSIQQNGG